jgi:hypothetical protein
MEHPIGEMRTYQTHRNGAYYDIKRVSDTEYESMKYVIYARKDELYLRINEYCNVLLHLQNNQYNPFT